MVSITKRRVGEAVIIDTDNGSLKREPITIEVTRMASFQVSLGISVPEGFRVYRKEIYDALKENQRLFNQQNEV